MLLGISLGYFLIRAMLFEWRKNATQSLAVGVFGVNFPTLITGASTLFLTLNVFIKKVLGFVGGVCVGFCRRMHEIKVKIKFSFK